MRSRHQQLHLPAERSQDTICQWIRSVRTRVLLNQACNWNSVSDESNLRCRGIRLSSIRADMTTTNHTALYRFTFPAAGNASSSPLILVDTIDLPLSRINATTSVDGDTGRITGSGTFVPSFGLGTYDLHFCADFAGASIRDTGVRL
jgi:putative alpha-1,2-mannosidase